MIGIDASIDQPRVCSTFTTRDFITQPKHREISAQLFRLIRSELGPVRYCSFLEFTTGKAATSGGLRRPHLHTLWKDVERDAAPVIAGIAQYLMERHTGAWRHQVDEIRTPGGAAMYVARHHQKEEQAPPASWGSPRRVRPSRGYYVLPARQLREMAASRLKQQRLYYRMEAKLRETGQEIPDEVLDRYLDVKVDEALAEPAPVVVRHCKPWEDSYAS